MDEDLELLQRYVREGSEPAFAELVRRNVDLVYSAALRQVGGDRHRAEDVSQAVFTTLAIKARSLAGHPALAGWMFSTTRFVAMRLMRSEWRRGARETEAMKMNVVETTEHYTADWERIRPILDEAICELNDSDREAVLLRFFHAKPLAEVGSCIGVSTDAAQKRVERALERLRDSLGARGITSTTAALAAACARYGVSAAPTSLASSIAGSALATASAGSAATGILIGLMNAKIATGVAVGVIVIGSAGIFITRNQSPKEAALPPPSPQSRPAVIPASERTVLTEPRSPSSLAEILGMADQLRALSLFAERLAALKPDEFAEEYRQLRAARGMAGDLSVSTQGFVINGNPLNRPAEFPQRDPFFRLFLNTWGLVDASAAMAAVGTLRSEGKDSLTVARYEDMVISGWILKDPEGAWNHLTEALKALPTRSLAGGRVALDASGYDRAAAAIQALANSGQSQAAAALLSSTNNPFGMAAARALTLVWARQNPEEALKWLRSLPSQDPRRDWGLNGLGFAATREDFDGARKLIANLETWDQGRFLLGAMQALDDPRRQPDALVFVLDATQDNSSGAFDHAISAYFAINRTNPAPVDFEREVALLERAKATDARIAFPGSFAARLMLSEPTKGMAVLSRYIAPPIATELNRMSSFRSYTREWSKRDPAGVRAYLSTTSDLPRETATMLLGELDSTPK